MTTKLGAIHRSGAAVLALAASTLLGAAMAQAQTAEVAGTWNLEVQTDQGLSTPSFTLEQDGTQLTGTYSSATLGTADVTGTVDGSEVTVSFEASLQGQSVPVVYKGTVGEDGTMSGTIDLAGGTLTGTFKGTRASS